MFSCALCTLKRSYPLCLWSSLRYFNGRLNEKIIMNFIGNGTICQAKPNRPDIFSLLLGLQVRNVCSLTFMLLGLANSEWSAYTEYSFSECDFVGPVFFRSFDLANNVQLFSQRKKTKKKTPNGNSVYTLFSPDLCWLRFFFRLTKSTRSLTHADTHWTHSRLAWTNKYLCIKYRSWWIFEMKSPQCCRYAHTLCTRAAAFGAAANKTTIASCGQMGFRLFGKSGLGTSNS